jgi:hypothetical protein
MGNPYEEKLLADWNYEAERKKFKKYLVQLNELFEKGEEIHPSNLRGQGTRKAFEALEEYAKLANEAHFLLYSMNKISEQYRLCLGEQKQYQIYLHRQRQGAELLSFEDYLIQSKAWQDSHMQQTKDKEAN